MRIELSDVAMSLRVWRASQLLVASLEGRDERQREGAADQSVFMS